MYPVSIAAVLLRLGIHRLLRDRMLHTGEVLALGLFEGAPPWVSLPKSCTFMNTLFGIFARQQELFYITP